MFNLFLFDIFHFFCSRQARGFREVGGHGRQLRGGEEDGEARVPVRSSQQDGDHQRLWGGCQVDTKEYPSSVISVSQGSNT